MFETQVWDLILIWFLWPFGYEILLCHWSSKPAYFASQFWLLSVCLSVHVSACLSVCLLASVFVSALPAKPIASTSLSYCVNLPILVSEFWTLIWFVCLILSVHLFYLANLPIGVWFLAKASSTLSLSVCLIRQTYLSVSEFWPLPLPHWVCITWQTSLLVSEFWPLLLQHWVCLSVLPGKPPYWCLNSGHSLFNTESVCLSYLANLPIGVWILAIASSTLSLSVCLIRQTSLLVSEFWP